MVSSASVPESSSLQTASFPSTSWARSCIRGKPWCPGRPPSPRTFGSMAFPLSLMVINVEEFGCGLDPSLSFLASLRSASSGIFCVDSSQPSEQALGWSVLERDMIWDRQFHLSSRFGRAPDFESGANPLRPLPHACQAPVSLTP
jgi:hypothetical protein